MVQTERGSVSRSREAFPNVTADFYALGLIKLLRVIDPRSGSDGDNS
jgi:hypothetical protein